MPKFGFFQVNNYIGFIGLTAIGNSYIPNLVNPVMMGNKYRDVDFTV
jgi:hypothetical protein